MTAGACAIHLTVVGAVIYHIYDARLFTAQRLPRISEYAEKKRREQNLFVFIGTSEAEVTNNRTLRSTYCTIKATDRHGASRGLSATAGLLVL